MNTTPDHSTPQAVEGETKSSPIAKWFHQFLDLVSCRLSILCIESRQNCPQLLHKILLIVLTLMSALFTWVFLCLGFCGLLNYTLQISWPFVFLIIGGIHLLLAVIFYVLMKRTSLSGFPHTLSEFQKDRTWLNQLKNPRA